MDVISAVALLLTLAEPDRSHAKALLILSIKKIGIPSLSRRRPSKLLGVRYGGTSLYIFKAPLTPSIFSFFQRSDMLSSPARKLRFCDVELTTHAT
ncbi:hypothetical protein PF008_g21132 [Phytophthora fragariae]|uniref:Uncharacterized protein n=2 Tax=Phytophthora TaxID=4783 RepID=A0A6A3KRN7_9STRA|nr:hypothetical protein PR002_g15478 [Phytophthora rubi]KAE9307852.1 hypothetical protein PF008_g21132 [Phytophthora fragariae]